MIDAILFPPINRIPWIYSSITYICPSKICLVIQLQDQMFSKLLDNPDLPHKEQKEIIKSVLTSNLKQNIHQVRLQFNHNYDKLKPILLNHWKYAFRLALSLHTWQVAFELLQGNRETPAIDLLLTLASEDVRTRGQSLIVDSTKSFTDNWRLLAILAVASEKIIQHLESKDYCWFLPMFVKTSATVIQGYLTIKNEPSQTSDRIDSDLKLVNHCEEWITNFFIKVISSLKCPGSDADRHTTLAALSQVCGALLQNEKGGQLLVEHLHKILKAAQHYLTSNYTLKQVRDAFITQLNEHNFQLRLKKIEIPDEYTTKSLFAKEGICWLLLIMLQEGSEIYSKQYRLSTYLLAFSESLESPLYLKEEALRQIKALWAGKIDCLSFEIDYPIGVLLFNVYSKLREQFDYFKQSLNIGKEHSLDLKRWRRLLNINFQNHNVDKITFVIKQVSADCIKEKEVLLLLKAIKFDFVDVAACKAFVELSTAVVETHPAAKKVLSWLINREKTSNRNPQLCKQLAKLTSQ